MSLGFTAYESTHVRLDNILPHPDILLKCKLTSVFSWIDPPWICMQLPRDKNGQVNQGISGTLVQFRNWKRLLRSSVDHYGKYRFARLRIVSLQDFKSSDPYETGPTNPSWSEEGIYMYYALSPLSVSVVGAKPLSLFITSRHEYLQHSCAAVLHESLKVLPFGRCQFC